MFGSGGASLHTKAFVTDDAATFVGSFNLDPRSANLNTEMGAFVEDLTLADQLRGEHRRLMYSSRRPAQSVWSQTIWPSPMAWRSPPTERR